MAIHNMLNYDKYSCCIYTHVFLYDGINMIINLTFHFIERRCSVGCRPGLHAMFPGHGAGVRAVWMARPHPPVLPQISAQETPRIQLTPYSFQCHKISTYAGNGYSVLHTCNNDLRNVSINAFRGDRLMNVFPICMYKCPCESE